MRCLVHTEVSSLLREGAQQCLTGSVLRSHVGLCQRLVRILMKARPRQLRRLRATSSQTLETGVLLLLWRSYRPRD